jgi:hypothetical protein
LWGEKKKMAGVGKTKFLLQTMGKSAFVAGGAGLFLGANSRRLLVSYEVQSGGLPSSLGETFVPKKGQFGEVAFDF